MDTLRLVAESGDAYFEIIEGRGEGFYVFRYEGHRNTHDHLQDTVSQAKECAFEEFGVPVDAWQEVAPGQLPRFRKKPLGE